LTIPQRDNARRKGVRERTDVALGAATLHIKAPLPRDDRCRPVRHRDRGHLHPARSEGWIEWNRRNYAEHGFGLWVIETHAGEFVGDCGLTMQEVEGTWLVEAGETRQLTVLPDPDALLPLVGDLPC
jgi:hypothetical protein